MRVNIFFIYHVNLIEMFLKIIYVHIYIYVKSLLKSLLQLSVKLMLDAYFCAKHVDVVCTGFVCL